MPNRLIVEELANGDGVRVSLQREGQYAEAADAAPFGSPLSNGDLEDLRWYLEDYIAAPYAVYEERGQTIATKLRAWGHALFESVLGAGKPGHDEYVQACEGELEVAIIARSAPFAGLPWELLWDPKRAQPIALTAESFDRTRPTKGAAAAVPPGDVLRVLMVIARPSGLNDVGYQMIARPLMERLEAVRGKVHLEVLRPATFATLDAKLQAAMDAGAPYHVLHFDGHGTFGTEPSVAQGPLRYASNCATGYLVFESKGGDNDRVSAQKFALAINRAKVPVVILNACKSGTVGQTAIEAAVATQVLEGGAASVVAMGYSVYAIAAAEFMAAFYEALFAGKSIAVAMNAGRRQLYNRKERPSPKGLLPLEDWLVPVHYTRRPVCFAELQRTRTRGTLSFDALLDQLGRSGSMMSAPVSTTEQLAPIDRFVGRDSMFYQLEQALQWQRVVIVRGPAGAGKTELAKAFGRWWRDSGGVGQPQWVFFHSFEPGAASFRLDGVITEIGLSLFGPDFIGRTTEADHRCQLLLKVLREHRMLLIWDNFESVYSFPDSTGATPPLDAAEQQQMRAFVHRLSSEESQSRLIITSRTPETWLGEVRRLELGGLKPLEAAEMAENVLRPYPTARLRREERAFAQLLEWLDGHPLSLRLLLPHLEHVSPAHLLSELRGDVTQLPPGFLGEERLASLGASLKYSFDQLDAAVRERLLALGLFEGVVDKNVLAIFSQTDGVPARFAGADKAWWTETLQRLADIGLLTELTMGMYGLHPALPAYVKADWRQIAKAQFDQEHAAAECALIVAYAGFAVWLRRHIEGGSAEAALALIALQRRTMTRLATLALSEKRYIEVHAILEPLNVFWDSRGLVQEAHSWCDRARENLEDRNGNAPDLESAAGGLWLFLIGIEANRALIAGDLEAAYVVYDRIRERLESSSGSERQERLSVTYHQLAIVVQRSGNLDAAERWYHKSLEINKARGDLPSMATSYHWLGTVAQDRRDLDAAERWYSKALKIHKELGDRPGTARSYHQLGTVALLRRDLDRAERRQQKSRKISEALGDQHLTAATYHQLGMVAQLRHDLDAAERWFGKALEVFEELRQRPELPATYHHLGMVAEHRGDLDAAERWYGKALEISEELGDRHAMASTYGQLGILSEKRNAPIAALDWMVRCVSLFPELANPTNGTGPSDLARLTASLGMAALEASWQRCTGGPLPAPLRALLRDQVGA